MNFWKIEVIIDWSLYTHEKRMKKGLPTVSVFFEPHGQNWRVKYLSRIIKWDEGKRTYSCRRYKKARDSEAISNNIARTLEISKRGDIKGLDIEYLRIDTHPGKLLGNQSWLFA